MEFSIFIKKLLEDNDMKAADLAAELEVDPSTVSKWITKGMKHIPNGRAYANLLRFCDRKEWYNEMDELKQMSEAKEMGKDIPPETALKVKEEFFKKNSSDPPGAVKQEGAKTEENNIKSSNAEDMFKKCLAANRASLPEVFWSDYEVETMTKCWRCIDMPYVFLIVKHHGDRSAAHDELFGKGDPLRTAQYIDRQDYYMGMLADYGVDLLEIAKEPLYFEDYPMNMGDVPPYFYKGVASRRLKKLVGSNCDHFNGEALIHLLNDTKGFWVSFHDKDYLKQWKTSGEAFSDILESVFVRIMKAFEVLVTGSCDDDSSTTYRSLGDYIRGYMQRMLCSRGVLTTQSDYPLEIARLFDVETEGTNCLMYTASEEGLELLRWLEKGEAYEEDF